jgi:hypothetical protein
MVGSILCSLAVIVGFVGFDGSLVGDWVDIWSGLVSIRLIVLHFALARRSACGTPGF